MMPECICPKRDSNSQETILSGRVLDPVHFFRMYEFESRSSGVVIDYILIGPKF
jgi:hypothetical protein